jgi:citronellol/citronellal dehydrogenase
VKGWNTVVNTNLNGTWYMMQGAARAWRDAGRPGSIVTIVVVTRQGLHGVAHTIAARSGVIGLTQALAVEWAPLKIRHELHRAGRRSRRRAGGSTIRRRWRTIRNPIR